MSFNDFDGEFSPIKELSKEEATSDPLVTSIKRHTKEVESQKLRKKSDLHFLKNFKKISQSLDPMPEPIDNDVADRPSKRHQSAAVASEIDSDSLASIKKSLRRQMINPDGRSIQGFSQLKSVVSNTVVDKEGASVIVVGPRGSGKTALINSVLKEFTASHGDQFVVIKLNAFIHPDNTAIRAISAQLDKALTKFPMNQDINLKTETRSLTSTFKNVLRLLDDSSATKGEFAVVFVMEELEAFTVDHKQVLLYNLFELTVTSSIPICIIGSTVKFTTRELLEKRVRSRFSQRLIVVNKPGSFEEFRDICISLLKAPEDKGSFEDKTGLVEWNKQVDQFAQTKTSKLFKLLQYHFYHSKGVKRFRNDCLLAINKLDSEKTLEDVLDISLLKPFHNPVQAVFESLSDLESHLLVAAARWITKTNLSAVNYNIAYKEYEEMLTQLNVEAGASRGSSTQQLNTLSSFKVSNKIWSSTVMKNCWNSLYRMGVIIDYAANTVEGGQMASNTNKYFVVDDTKMLQVDISLAELNQLFDDNNLFKKLTKL